MKIEFFESEANAQPLDDFLGLTPEQMHILLYSPLEEMQHIFGLKDTFDQNLLEKVPIVKKVVLLIKFISEAGDAKATQNGYLPKKIVNALYDFHSLDKFTVPTEEYAPNILALRHAVTDCGWLKKKSGRFSLTKKGKQIFEKGFTPPNYIALLKYWLRKYNWAFTDGYPECSIVQQAAPFSLYLLSQKATELISSEHFAQLFIRAFPFALEELPAEPHPIEQPGEERLASIFRLRFLERFAAYFGLVDCLIDEKLPYLERDKSAQIKTTRLFAEALCWFSPDKRKIKTEISSSGNHSLH